MMLILILLITILMLFVFWFIYIDKEISPLNRAVSILSMIIILIGLLVYVHSEYFPMVLPFSSDVEILISATLCGIGLALLIVVRFKPF